MNMRHAELTLIQRIAAVLCPEFAGVFSLETVERLVGESYALFAKGARITGYLSILTERFSRDRLGAAAQAEGSIMKSVPEVLFVCVHNAGRSQMAAALLDHLGGGRVHVRSAGSAPADSINPLVVEVLEEIGLDVTKEYPKPLTDEFVRAADVVVSMGCGDACPVYPGKRYLDWDLQDPAGMTDVDGVRRLRDEIRRRVEGLIDELFAPQTQSQAAQGR
jgi:arsenate reductase (thioredoxin)